MMWNCRWLLCLIVTGLATREASSMNEQPRRINDSPKTIKSSESLSSTTNSNGKGKSENEPSVKDGDQELHSSPGATATAEIPTSITKFNVTVAFVAPNDGASTYTNDTKMGTQGQSHSKRHFRHSKLYRNQARPKSRTSLTKSSMASGNAIPFSTDHLLVPSQILFHNSENNTDSINLLESTPRTRAVITTHDDSISTPSSRSFFTSGSREDTSDEKFDNLSSRMTFSSGSTANWNNPSSSSSSEAESVVDEKSSSVELMEFTFASVEEIRKSTSPSEIVKRVENSTTSASNAMDHSSSTKVVPVQTSDRSIDESKSASDDLRAYGGIDRGQSIQSARNDADDDVTIYSVHAERSRDAKNLSNEFSSPIRRDNLTNDDSVILVSIASESTASRNSRDTSSKGVGRSDDESNSTNFENNSNHSSPNVDGYSWVSVDDSLNRISLPNVVDTLKNVNLRETRGSYSYSNSTQSQDTDTSFESVAVPAKHLQSSTFPDPEIKSSDNSFASVVSQLTKKSVHPLELIVPSNIQTIAKAKTKNNIIFEDVKLPGPSTSADLSSRKKAANQRVAGKKDLPFRSVLNLEPSASQCSSDSSTERLQDLRSIDSENPFYHRRSSEITLSVSGNSIPDPEQCLTQHSSAQTPLHSIHEPERPEALISTVIPSNTEEKEVVLSKTANKSQKTEVEAVKSSQSEIDEHRGAQSLVSSDIIILENFEPVIRESLVSEGSPVPFESQTIPAGHFFTAFADLEEHCNASSLNVFIPSINSRENLIARVKCEEEPFPSLVSREPENLTTTEDSLYIIEGFGFLKNSVDDVSELDEEFDRRREVSFDYSDTETYPGYPQLNDHPTAVKFIDQIEFGAGLPVQQEPLAVARLQRNTNTRNQNDDPWWSYHEFERRRDQSVQSEHAEERTVSVPSGFPAWKDVHAVSSQAEKVLPDINESKINSYRFFLLPTVYVLIGICIVLVGCSIWCGRVSIKRQQNLPKLTYFIQEKEGATHNVV